MFPRETPALTNTDGNDNFSSSSNINDTDWMIPSKVAILSIYA